MAHRYTVHTHSYLKLMPALGFEKTLIGGNNKEVFWKEVDDYGAHIIVMSIDDRDWPDLVKNPARIILYRGPDLQECRIHEEVAYEQEDLELFLQAVTEILMKRVA